MKFSAGLFALALTTAFLFTGCGTSTSEHPTGLGNVPKNESSVPDSSSTPVQVSSGMSCTYSSGAQRACLEVPGATAEQNSLLQKGCVQGHGTVQMQQCPQAQSVATCSFSSNGTPLKMYFYGMQRAEAQQSCDDSGGVLN